MNTTEGLRFLDARISEIGEAATLLKRNATKQEWTAMESNLLYTVAKAETALARLRAMQQEWINEMDAA